MSNFEDLPLEIVYSIIRNINCNNIINLSIVNKYLLSICDENMWKQYIIEKKDIIFYNYFKLNKQTWKQIALKYLIKYKIITIKNETSGISNSMKIYLKTNLVDITRYCGYGMLDYKYKLIDDMFECTFTFESQDKIYHIHQRDGNYYMKNFVSNLCEYDSLFTDIKGAVYSNEQAPKLLF